MSSITYGALTRRRIEAPSQRRIGTARFLLQEDGTLSAEQAQQPQPVKRWQDALAALVPAEVLALHALVVSVAASEEVTSAEATSVIETGGSYQFLFWGLVALPAVLYVIGASGLRTSLDVVRMLIPSGAFVAWTLLQPTSAFDWLEIDVDGTVKLFIGIFAAIVLGGLSVALVGPADEA